GTMDAAIRIPPGKSMIKIQAKGSPADGIFPRMMVELDGRMIGEAYIKNNDWRSYEFKINTDGGIKVLSVSFLNDSSSKNGKEDRNLYIGIAKAI
ncbi:MAG: carbohydrate-binding domain-containing protein, partial [Candidatus Omnitrophica bacterium]|nr:carbohydrate-binding domain-containing protein [Candidatus Omnitrophota bacterium]